MFRHFRNWFAPANCQRKALEHVPRQRIFQPISGFSAVPPGRSVFDNRILVIPVKLRRRERLIQDGVWLLGWWLGDFQKAIKFSLEKVGKPERELKRDQYGARRENMLFNKDGASGVAKWIWQIVLLSIIGLFAWLCHKRLRSCTSRFCRAYCVSSKRSSPRAAKQVRTFFFYVCILQREWR